MTSRFVHALIVFATASVATSFVAAQENPQRDMQKEGVIVAQLEAISPESVAAFEAATSALDGDDFERAAIEYRSVLETVPDFDPALRRLGGAYVELGHYDKGIALIERAVAINRSPENIITLAYRLAVPGEGRAEVSREVLTRAHSLAVEAGQLDPKDPETLALTAQLSLQLEMMPAFDEAVDRLLANHPEKMPTRYFAAVRAALDEDWVEAEHQILEAGRLGLPREAVDEFLAMGVGSRATTWRWARYAAIATAAWAAGLLLLFVVGKTLSAMTLASVERDDPNTEVSGATRKLRSSYRRVVTAAGFYWYVSLPFVALVVVALTASLIYGFLMIGRIPIKLAAIVIIGAVVTLYAIVRSLFIRIRDDEDPGRAVTEADAPALWAVAREVAARVGTRPIDEIWLTPGTELAVYERGGMRAKMSDTARRALLLGAGVLDGFDQNAFQAVLAHEYGHFSHRDTAGGEVAMRVQNGMWKFAGALADAGYAVWWNLAFQFLRLYDFLFRRISHGASRLQEVLADRVAIQRYGLDAFKEGLTHVIRRSVIFDHAVDVEINDAIERQRPLANLYSLAEPTDRETNQTIEQRVASALEEETTEDNTHPSPKDRFRLGERIAAIGAGYSRGLVWSLFEDPEAIKAELTAEIAARITDGTGVDVRQSQA